MRLIIHAVNIHQGGGSTLLLALISALQKSAVLLLDKRFNTPNSLNPDIVVKTYSPTILSRLKAECHLRKISKSDDIVLCFGNLPPLFKSRGKVFVYLQNRYLCSDGNLEGFSIKIKIRIALERIWLKLFLRDATVIVQSETMQRNTLTHLGRKTLIMPFASTFSAKKSNKAFGKDYDFLYVASGEPHKNHLNLIKAWIVLAKLGLFPSLCLTLHPERDNNLINTLELHKKEYGLKITNNPVTSDEVSELYMRSSTLIYPSFFESFGLPLIEAKTHGLSIIASERDYIRDVIQPDTTFDPESEVSIARAVMRHMGINYPTNTLLSANQFLNNLTHSD